MSLIKSLGSLNSSGSGLLLPGFFVPGRLFNEDVVWYRCSRPAEWALSSPILGSMPAFTDAGRNHEPPAWEGEESKAKI